MGDIIVTTPEQLRGLIREVFLEVAPTLKAEHPTPDFLTRTNLTIDEAVEFLTSQGLPITKSSLYGLVFKRRVPHSKIGRRLIFSKNELLEWLQNNTKTPREKQEAAERIANHCKA